MTPAGLAAFEARDEDRSAIYSYEQRHDGAARARAGGAAARRPGRVGVVPGPAAVVAARRRLLGHERQEARDARAAAGDADRGRGRRPHAEGAHAARVIRPPAGCACWRMNVIDAPGLGLRFEIREHSEDLLEFDAVGRTRGFITQYHVHTIQSEHFEVIEGTLRLVVDGREHLLGPGETMEIPAGTPHRQLAGDEGSGRVRVQVRPAARTMEFLELLAGCGSTAGAIRGSLGGIADALPREPPDAAAAPLARVRVRGRVGRRRAARVGVRRDRRRAQLSDVVEARLPVGGVVGRAGGRERVAPALQGAAAVPPAHALADHAAGGARTRSAPRSTATCAAPGCGR